jgi:hypothetical protein
MATRSASPTAQLLRSSRLFSLPRPLPPPARGRFDSESATSPYPTHQAITRPAGAPNANDWGLKRPLPNKAAGKGRQTTIKIVSHDTDELVTEYDSANHHTRTLQKWQEMGIPMRAQSTEDSTYGVKKDPGLSAFHAGADLTDQRAVRRILRGEGMYMPRPARVYKYETPPIKDMTNGDFEQFIGRLASQSGLRRRFFSFYKKKLIENELILRSEAHRRRQLAENKKAKKDRAPVGQFDVQAEEAQVSEIFTDAKCREHLIRTRQIMPDERSTLGKYIEEFLNLPSRSIRPEADIMGRNDRGPAPQYTTHPSAGLSYMYNKHHLENHPTKGPRLESSPVEARTLSLAPHILGVGGIAARDANSTSVPTESMMMEGGGGAKRWVVPQFATINSQGRIDIGMKASTVPAREDANDDSEVMNRALPDIARKRRQRAKRMDKAVPLDAAAGAQSEGSTIFDDLAMLKMNVRNQRQEAVL